MEPEIGLADTWRVTGSSLEEYKSMSRKLAEATQFAAVSPRDLSFVYAMGESRDSYRVKQFSYFSLTRHERQVRSFIDNPDAADVEYLLSKKEVDEPLAEESFKATGFILCRKNEKDPYYVSAQAKRQLCRMAGLTGQRTAENSAYMTEEICKALGEQNNVITFVVRSAQAEGRTLRKIFAAVSGRYQPDPVSGIEDVLNAVTKDGRYGKPSVHGWFISNQLTRLHAEFPERQTAVTDKDTLIPGLEFSTSDTGTSSFLVRRTFRFLDTQGYVTDKSIGAIHAAAQMEAKEAMIRSVSAMLSGMDAYPEKLKEAAKIPVPEAKTEKDREKAIRSLFDRLNLTKIIGVKRKSVLIPMLSREKPEGVFTEYDRISRVMKLTDSANLDSIEMQDRLSKALGKAPDILMR